jgi:hypothetical protein
MVRMLGFAVVLMLLSVGDLSAQCAPGKITCRAWCKKYNSTATACLAGHPRSCDAMPGKANACVTDNCNPGKITCGQWCAKYRNNSEACLRTHSGSCMKKYGSLTHCVVDSPPG